MKKFHDNEQRLNHLIELISCGDIKKATLLCWIWVKSKTFHLNDFKKFINLLYNKE